MMTSRVLDDPEGDRIPSGLPPVVDAHVHVFPDRLFEAIRRWFDAHAWSIRYRMPAGEVLDFLLSRGVAHVVALHYAHKAGMARELNRFVAALCAERPRVTGAATVLPGEEGAAEILEEAFALGLVGVKLHCHVQCFGVDDPALDEIYEVCAAARMPLVIHAGREPSSPAYRCDTHALCSADRVARVLERHPSLRICVPHLGVDEIDAYGRLVRKHENLWLDTTMMLSGYFDGYPPVLHGLPPERLLYGTDFPNVPYAWDRELRALSALGLEDAALESILFRNACELFRIDGVA